MHTNIYSKYKQVPLSTYVELIGKEITEIQ